MWVFHRAKDEAGHFTREHQYLGQGVTAVCVPNRNYVYQRFMMPRDETRGPYPVLLSLLPNWPGDVRTGVFLGELLSYLELELAPKETLNQTFNPIFTECRTTKILDLFGDGWKPCLASSSLGRTLNVDGAREYVRRFEAFRRGLMGADEVVKDLNSPPRDPIKLR